MTTGANFFFYDLETSGFNPRAGRVMQFAGQRTDMQFKPIGQPVSLLIKLTADVLPEPDAVMLTGITPQQTVADGLSEAEFLRHFYDTIIQPGTIFVGYNNLRFDDEFMRFLHYRNFYDAYEWHWKDGRTRWDLLDVARMTRALRPDGIKWPFASDGKPANRLEFLSKLNKLDHSQAHDALSDVKATIALARLLCQKQPELFDYLLQHRDKQIVKRLVTNGAPFVYTSGRYSSQYLHTTAATLLAPHPEQDAALVYDLRSDPTPFLGMSPHELAEAWKFSKDPDALRLPVKELKYNRCPAVAPLGVIKDEASQRRLSLDIKTITKHLAVLKQHHAAFTKNVSQALKQRDEERQQAQTALVDNQLAVDERLYDDFINDVDRKTMRAVQTAKPTELDNFAGRFRDSRLENLLPLYKARNYPKALNQEERKAWNEFRHKKLLSGGQDSHLARYDKRLQELASGTLNAQQQYLLEELRLYGESIAPVDAVG